MSEAFECGADSAAYVLGALDTHECGMFERHLQACTVCQAEVESLRGVTQVLAMAAPQYPLPAKLRRRVLAQVRAEAHEREVTQRTTRHVVSLPRTRPLHRPGLVGGFAMAVLLAALVLVSLVSSPSSRVRVVSASVGSAQLVMRGSHAELIVHHLAPLSRSRTYEVWIERTGDPKPQPTPDLFNVSPSGSSAVDLPNMQGVTTVMVTDEPAGGRAVPSSAPVVVARID